MATGFRRLEIAARFAQAPSAWIQFDGRPWLARAGEPLAVTLLAHGLYTLGRSNKYHRPRGMFCGTGNCGQCVVSVDGQPSVKACLQTVHNGLQASAQNTLGGARRDILGVVDRLFFRGLDHHHLMTRSTWLNRLAVGITRQLAGQGRLPAGTDSLPPTLAEEHCAVVVVGAGPAGLAVAQQTRSHGLATTIFEASGATLPEVRNRCRVVGFYDDRYLLVAEPHGLRVVTGDVIVLANGGYEQPPACVGNDAPGVMGLQAAMLALRFGVVPGWRVVLAAPDIADTARHIANNQAVSQLADRLLDAGVTIAATLGCPGPAAAQQGSALAKIASQAPHLQVWSQDDSAAIFCDAVIWCAPPVPAYELAAQMGVDAPYEPRIGGFVPLHDAQGATRRDGVFVAGEVAGVAAHEAYEHGKLVGATVARRMRLVNEGAFA